MPYHKHPKKNQCTMRREGHCNECRLGRTLNGTSHLVSVCLSVCLSVFLFFLYIIHTIFIFPFIFRIFLCANICHRAIVYNNTCFGQDVSATYSRLGWNDTFSSVSVQQQGNLSSHCSLWRITENNKTQVYIYIQSKTEMTASVQGNKLKHTRG